MPQQWIEIAAADGGHYEAYLALPPAGRGPGLVLFQEIFGVNRHIRTVADQYALDGFVVLAPDVFWRSAPRVELGYEGADRERAMKLVQGADSAALAADVRSSVAALRARPECAGSKLGAFGYCMGGRLAYLAAAAGSLDAAACFYAGGIQGLLDKAHGVNCPIQFHFGERDAHIPLSVVEQVKSTFAGRPAEVFLYDAEHGFNCWDRASYDAPSSALAHARTLQHFASHLF